MSKTELPYVPSANDIISIKVVLAKPFTDFLKEYIAFFGAKATLEEFCRGLIYAQVDYLYRELGDFAKQSEHLLKEEDWSAKHPHLNLVSFEEEETEQERGETK